MGVVLTFFQMKRNDTLAASMAYMKSELTLMVVEKDKMSQEKQELVTSLSAGIFLYAEPH